MIIRRLGIRPFSQTWNDMVGFTHTRTADTPDELWLLEHNPVFTQGTSCSMRPMEGIQDIEVIHTDRGGQITYHGPGQLIGYLLVDIKRLGSGPKSFVKSLEQAVIRFLEDYGISGARKPDAPGVYVEGKKIAALGLRISRGCCYHGISINIDMDLSPFDYIDACGYPGLEVTQVSDLVPGVTMKDAVDRLGPIIINSLNKYQ